MRALVGLLSDLNAEIGLFERAANARAARLEAIQIAAVIATLLALFIEVITVFYPAHRTVDGMIRRLRFQASHDPLTGLVNRARFLARIKEPLEANCGQAERLFALALDLDGFKDVNDVLGHPVGDQVLLHIARILEARLAAHTGSADSAVSRVGAVMDIGARSGVATQDAGPLCAGSCPTAFDRRARRATIVGVASARRRFGPCACGYEADRVRSDEERG